MHIMNNAKGLQFTIKNADHPSDHLLKDEGYKYVITTQPFTARGKLLGKPSNASWAKTFVEAIECARRSVTDIYDTIVIDWRNIEFDETHTPDGRLEFKIN